MVFNFGFAGESLFTSKEKHCLLLAAPPLMPNTFEQNHSSACCSSPFSLFSGSCHSTMPSLSSTQVFANLRNGFSCLVRRISLVSGEQFLGLKY